jgi:hypothetical protein
MSGSCGTRPPRALCAPEAVASAFGPSSSASFGQACGASAAATAQAARSSLARHPWGDADGLDEQAEDGGPRAPARLAAARAGGPSAGGARAGRGARASAGAGGGAGPRVGRPRRPRRARPGRPAREQVFGHPYEERPSQQLVETAASEAVDIVLGRPVALREGYLSAQVQRLTADSTFLSDDEEAVTEYARTVHLRSAQDLRIWFVKKIWSALDSVFSDPSLDRLQRRGVWFMRAFLLEDVAILSEWDAVDDLPDHRRVIAAVLADKQVFPHLSKHAGDIVVNALVEQAAGDPSFLNVVFNLAKAGSSTSSSARRSPTRSPGTPYGDSPVAGCRFELTPTG